MNVSVCVCVCVGVPAGRVLFHIYRGVRYQVDHASVCPHTQTYRWVGTSRCFVLFCWCLSGWLCLIFSYDLPQFLINCWCAWVKVHRWQWRHSSLLRGLWHSCVFWLQVCRLITTMAGKSQWVCWFLLPSCVLGICLCVLSVCVCAYCISLYKILNSQEYWMALTTYRIIIYTNIK